MTATSEDCPPIPQRILILKPSALGDIISATPVLRGLRRQFPNAHIAWVVNTELSDLLTDDPDLNEVVPFPRRRLGKAWRNPAATIDLVRFLRQLRKARYDWVIDLQGLLRSGLFAAFSRAPLRAGLSKRAGGREGAPLFYTHRLAEAPPHTVDRNLSVARMLGVDVQPEDMTLHVSQAAAEQVDSLLAGTTLESGRFCICAPPTQGQAKHYPVRHWRTLLEKLSQRIPVAITGTAGDEALCAAVADGFDNRVVNLAGRTTLPQLTALIAQSACVVCCDSAPQFIAPAVGVNVVTLMGPTRIERTGPYRLGRAVVADVPCQGCLRRKCQHVTCMETLQPDDVYQAVSEFLTPKGL